MLMLTRGQSAIFGTGYTVIEISKKHMRIDSLEKQEPIKLILRSRDKKNSIRGLIAPGRIAFRTAKHVFFSFNLSPPPHHTRMSRFSDSDVRSSSSPRSLPIPRPYSSSSPASSSQAKANSPIQRSFKRMKIDFTVSPPPHFIPSCMHPLSQVSPTWYARFV